MTTRKSTKPSRKPKAQERGYTYEEYLNRFAPDLRDQEEESGEQFAARLAKDTIDILRDGKVSRR